MIQANELRVGNWVHMISQNRPYEIDRGKDIDNSEDFIPIPLTEEILLKCEGHELMAEGVIEYNRFTLTYMPAYKYWYVTTIDGYVTKVEYLHEWQNVVFALNNHELQLSHL